MSAAQPTGRDVAVVTGGAGGMGEHICSSLLEAGFRVVVTDLDLDAAQRTASALDPAGDRAMALRLDVGCKSDFETVLEQCGIMWDVPSVLVSNAALTQAADVMTISLQDFSSVLTLNASSVLLGAQVFGAAMRDRGYGRIINMASLAGQNGGTATGVHYAASKGAILTLTKVFSRELAGHGVTVNAISPGPHDLPVVHQTVPAEQLARIVEGIPVRSLGDPAFVGSMVALLASPQAGFVTGACWDVNGGLYIR